MPAGKGPLRFRRTDAESGRWHRAAKNYRPTALYRSIRGLCGYTLQSSVILRDGFKMSKAIKPSKGELCLKCEKEAELRRAAKESSGSST